MNKNDVLGTLLSLGLGAVFLGLIFGGSALFNSFSCHYKYSDIGETNYGFISGCRVKYKGVFVPANNLRIGDM